MTPSTASCPRLGTPSVRGNALPNISSPAVVVVNVENANPSPRHQGNTNPRPDGGRFPTEPSPGTQVTITTVAPRNPYQNHNRIAYGTPLSLGFRKGGRAIPSRTVRPVPGGSHNTHPGQNKVTRTSAREPTAFSFEGRRPTRSSSSTSSIHPSIHPRDISVPKRCTKSSNQLGKKQQRLAGPRARAIQPKRCPMCCSCFPCQPACPPCPSWGHHPRRPCPVPHHHPVISLPSFLPHRPSRRPLKPKAPQPQRAPWPSVRSSSKWSLNTVKGKLWSSNNPPLPPPPCPPPKMIRSHPKFVSINVLLPVVVLVAQGEKKASRAPLRNLEPPCSCSARGGVKDVVACPRGTGRERERGEKTPY